MSTITREFTKEQLQQIIETDHVQCGETSSLARIALASLEAEPRGYIDAGTPDDGISILTENKLLKTDIALYTAPPAPVSVPDFGALTKCIVQRLVDYGAADDDAIARAEEFVYNACRAAMLQGAENSESRCTIQTAPALDSLPKIAESRCSNHQVIPDWQAKAEKLAELHGSSFVVFRNGESPQCADPTKVIISFTDEGLWHSETGHFRENSNSSTNNFRESAETSTKCWCRTCRPITLTDMRFVVCPQCGNKRCPHANDHRHACTRSNEPGQEGSAYPAVPQQEAKNV
ncbi:hypothetical protein [Enterobacter roggenkampii]|uniref:hypothetical protein n=1 Tax=Enterobacter roggenkampii TaxID=1812935 RepID=UPI0020177EC0|nr:hypothetical protein [Enterobacter roggenkampii]